MDPGSRNNPNDRTRPRERLDNPRDKKKPDPDSSKPSTRQTDKNTTKPKDEPPLRS